jgi:hypothetical protein
VKCHEHNNAYDSGKNPHNSLHNLSIKGFDKKNTYSFLCCYSIAGSYINNGGFDADSIGNKKSSTMAAF